MAAHVHWDTMTDAVSPVLMLRPAQVAAGGCASGEILREIDCAHDGGERLACSDCARKAETEDARVCGDGGSDGPPELKYSAVSIWAASGE